MHCAALWSELAFVALLMKLLFTKSKWETPELGLGDFLDKVRAARFEGSEIVVARLKESPEEIHEAHATRELTLVAQVQSVGTDVSGHLRTLEEHLTHAARCHPLLINCQGGSDLLSDQENQSIYRLGIDLARTLDVEVCFETHRSRPTFSGPSTRRLIEALPDLRLTADLSHWMCVHESLLENQPENVAMALQRSDHLHCRIGFPQGPQVSHPLAPENEALRAIYLGWWRKLIALRKAEGREVLTITPEAGPPPYMPILPFSAEPVSDAWTVNTAMRDWLEVELNAG